MTLDPAGTLLTEPTRAVPIDHFSAVHLAAATARTLARRCGLPGALPDRAAVVASELASNIAKHASGGSLYLQPLGAGEGIEILAADRGPGMGELERCLADGYTTTNSLGAGLGAVSRIATSFTIRTRQGHGTLVCARLLAGLSGSGGSAGSGGFGESGVSGGPGVSGGSGGSASAADRPVGSLRLAAQGEEHCGDASAIATTEHGLTALAVDGLGHGAQAQEAAQLALRCFHRAPDAELPALLTATNRALRHSRGAAVGVLRLRGGEVLYCGVGNVRAVLLSADEVGHHLTGQPGVVGWNMPTPQVRRLAAPPGATAVLHTDGIDARWSRAPDPFLLRLPPPLLATALVHGYRRSRDDATVLVVRQPLGQPLGKQALGKQAVGKQSLSKQPFVEQPVQRPR
ncbi:SpoIIE family protein phosphatase [Streptomyces sp. p1417]|uniref:SpoIIE family protein phosphatase n=1 Tax=Streptomyces typhae TaxID=2681492 RepID=A0A6L6WVL0_9ACTN|nr:SpoIIE family protein phosphatase [Streptomyces typhae]MVO85629.1 SpoIIE family protein phosphatase [Streptomyces typhae]